MKRQVSLFLKGNAVEVRDGGQLTCFEDLTPFQRARLRRRIEAQYQGKAEHYKSVTHRGLAIDQTSWLRRLVSILRMG